MNCFFNTESVATLLLIQFVLQSDFLCFASMDVDILVLLRYVVNVEDESNPADNYLQAVRVSMYFIQGV